MSETRPPLSAAQRLRYGLYALAITVTFFLILDGVITALEERGVLSTADPDDQVSTLSGDPWVLDGAHWVVSPVAGKAMVDGRFAAEKGARFRLFMLGGSFMRGVPYVGVGTIRFWLHRELQRRFPASEVEVINAAATSQNSHRVREIAGFAAKRSPDVMVIASCNNEGALPPSDVQKRLVKSGTFRLLKTLLRPESDEPRPLHTPQDPDIDAVREAFRRNLTEMVRVGRAAGAAVYLCTLPLNLRYEGQAVGRSIAGGGLPGELSATACAQRGEGYYRDGEYRLALEALSSCDDVEALRWAGLSHYALGEYATARRVLEQYTELQPRNRCRRSFQRVIREVAEAERVPLVDLETYFNELAPHSIPGSEHFKSYCHMNWRSQALIADQILAALSQQGDLPPGPRAEPDPELRGVVFRKLGGHKSERGGFGPNP